MILDIDDTLTWADPYCFETEKYDFEVYLPDRTFYVKKRDKLDDFLTFCFQNFDYVCVWSAGSELYVNKMTEKIFENHPSPHVIFNREMCDLNGLSYKKPIKKMVEKILVDFGQCIVENKCFIVDDKESSICQEDKEHAIIVSWHDDTVEKLINVIKDKISV